MDSLWGADARLAKTKELASLPNLRELTLQRAHSVSFVASLAHLRTLRLYLSYPWPVSAAAVIAALSQCTLLEFLSFSAPIDSQDLHTLLPRLPSLTILVLVACIELESLSVFAECPSLQHTLKRLALIDCRHPDLRLAQLKSVYTLKALTELVIERSFAQPMDDFTQSLHQPPSLLLPNLTGFRYTPRPPEADAAEEENEQDQ